MKTFKTLVIACAVNLFVAMPGVAGNTLTKQEVKDVAVELCVSEAQRRYGDAAVAYADESAKIYRDISRVKWNKSMKGAMVNMKIKKRSKRLSSYACLVKTDKTVTFFRV